ncbi:GGDEF domain-containing protein [Rathayibacter soli]|uniref:GGDEF domain-containing protein n=1 Tax=Rathayibacter soli TaxID=3144168 RepID=UPI0027E4F7AC|nr:GGDEF domain-containing protein [Glaciibacter superstes]
MIQPITLDVPTLFIASALVVTLTAVMFVIDSLGRGEDTVGRLWSLAYVAATTTTFAYLLSSVYPPMWWGIPLGNGAAVLGFGAIWSGARRFNDRRILLWVVLIVAAGVALVPLMEGPHGGYWAGADVMFWAMAAFGLLAGVECLRPRLLGLNGARFLGVLMLLSGLYYLGRVIFLYLLGPNSPVFTTFFGSAVTALVLVMFVTGGTISMVSLRGEDSRQTFTNRRSADLLTETASPHQFADVVTPMLDAARESAWPIALVIADIDELANINAAFGRTYGDQVLVRFVEVLRAATPFGTPLCRMVANRFEFLLADATAAEAATLAERIRLYLVETPLVGDGTGVRVTASFGVAGSETAGYGLRPLQDTALDALAESKAAGRNRIVVASVLS